MKKNDDKNEFMEQLSFALATACGGIAYILKIPQEEWQKELNNLQETLNKQIKELY